MLYLQLSLRLPTDHSRPLQAALNAGKHVVVEKPLTPTSEEAHELAKLAKEKNLVLAVYQNRRWDSDFLTVKKLLKKGAFGELSEFQVGLLPSLSDPRAWS